MIYTRECGSEVHRSGGNAAACHAQIYIMSTLLRHESEAQKDFYLPRITSGELRLQAFGVTEPDAGTDTTHIRTTAVRQGNHYLIRGQKIWTPRAQYSDLMLLLARTTPISTNLILSYVGQHVLGMPRSF